MENREPSFLDLLLETHIGLERQGPGSPEAVDRALGFLGPLDRFRETADLGCGTGGQTLLLAERLPGRITGLDMFPAFAEELSRKAGERGLGDRVSGIAGDMARLPFEKDSLDLIWSEGAIDNIGFREGLSHWRGFLRENGCIAVTCPSWLTEERPEEAERFWTDAGSRLDPVEDNTGIMQECGYAFIAAFALPEECWTDNYYAPRAKAIESLLKKYPGSETAKQYAELNRREVDLYMKYKQHYGYVFYIGRAV
ncbi:MAG: class I SAM-dependent methyltransferase [Oscillospiraceae bacterium]|nr:class I SAM-dependent methyltransferase [Oscillospiraceae bacterium]